MWYIIRAPALQAPQAIWGRGPSSSRITRAVRMCIRPLSVSTSRNCPTRRCTVKKYRCNRCLWVDRRCYAASSLFALAAFWSCRCSSLAGRRCAPDSAERSSVQGCSWRDNVFRPRCRVLALRTAPYERYPITPQECLCVATAGRPRRISLTCHADTCSILPLHTGTLAASHKVHSRVRHFPLAAYMWPEFSSPAAG